MTRSGGSDLNPLTEGLLIKTEVPGIYGRSAVFEDVRLALDAAITTRLVSKPMLNMRFPPLLPRRWLEDSGYLESFPHLAGTVFAFCGDERAARIQQSRAAEHADWSEFQRMTDLVLCPAACYPVYPVVARWTALSAEGVAIDLGASYVFRHEPSAESTRLQAFHQREFVRVGAENVAREWRDEWSGTVPALLRSLGLMVTVVPATDSFFGRAGRMLRSSQLEQALKLEAQLVLRGGGEPVALASFNYHQSHFGTVFDIRLDDASSAHTACTGLGEERIVIALFDRHGSEPDRWPAAVRQVLWPTGIR